MAELTAQKNEQNGKVLEFNIDKIKKGTSAGKPTLRPDLSKLTLEDKLIYLGKEQAEAIIDSKLNSLSNVCFNEAYDEETGEFDSEKWSKLIQGITIAGETIGDLEDKIDDLKTEALKLVSTPGVDFMSIQGKIQDIGKRVRDMEESLAERKKAAAERAAKRKATQAANEAKAAATSTTPAPVQA